MSIKKIIYIIVGLICVGLGGLGVALPVLPTTPFLLVAAFCFARSSERLDTWFKGTKLYKNNLESYAKHQGMDNKTKLRIMTTVTIIMAIAVACMYRVPIGQICVGCVWVLHVIAFAFIIKSPEKAHAHNQKLLDKAIAEGAPEEKIEALRHRLNPFEDKNEENEGTYEAKDDLVASDDGNATNTEEEKNN